MPREFNRQQLEQILASNVTMGGEHSPVCADDIYRDGNMTYRVGDMLEAIKQEMGLDYNQFLKLPQKRKRIIAERAQKKLRQRKKEIEREKRRADKNGIRELRVDDIININGFAVSAANLDGKIKDIIDAIASEKFQKPNINDMITMAMIMLKEEGKVTVRLPHHPDNSVVYCGMGETIRDCVFRSSVGVPDRLVPVFANDPGAAQFAAAKSEDRERIEFENRVRAAMKVVEAWIKRGEFKLEKPQGSSLHHLAEYSRVFGEGRFYRALLPGGKMADLQDFVIEHNWAGAFASATDFSRGDFRLPYTNCAFEFRISGFRLIMLYGQDETGTVICDSGLVGYDEMWLLLPFGFTVGPQETGGKLILEDIGPEDDECIPRVTADECRKLYELANAQVRACGIMLEAEVAVTETIRAPHKLNARREQLGRAKLRDHHVVVLNRRRRSAPLPAEYRSDEKRSSPRLHFRCGHWRHFANHRTWINWQLVGDPDLGFVDKHYRL